MSGLYEVVITTVAAVSVLVAAGLFVKSGFLRKLLVKFGLKEQLMKTNWSAFSWESCLQKMNCRADVVFFGDSIIRGGDFHLQFPDEKVVNLGSSGDTLAGMCGRVSTVQLLEPKRVFFLGGINGLTDYNGKICLKTYKRLISRLQEALPEAEIYIHSLLPVTKKRERGLCKNSTIVWFNGEIKKIAQEKGLIYIDLHSRYVVDGVLNSTLCREDGLHLVPEGYAPWYAELQIYLSSANIKK